MKPVARDEIIDWVTWTEQRPEARPQILAAKELRRILVDSCFTFLFENRDTVRYQVQEMLRVERIVKEADIVHELATYNELLGKEGELGATLLIGIDDEQQTEQQNYKENTHTPLPIHRGVARVFAIAISPQ